MLKIMRFGSLTIGSGVIIGLGVVAWIHTRAAELPTARNAGGSVVLGLATEPTPTPASVTVPAPRVTGASLDESRVSTPGTQTSATPTTNELREPTMQLKPRGIPSSQTVPPPTNFEQYEVYNGSAQTMIAEILAGTGATAQMGTRLSVRYRGWLTDGTEFDSTYKLNNLFSFNLGAHNVIAGWEEGLLGMKVGGTRRLIIPASKAYGSQAHDPIPANSLLIFDVELVGVQ